MQGSPGSHAHCRDSKPPISIFNGWLGVTCRAKKPNARHGGNHRPGG
jgi:hypothetical protein